MGNSRLEFLMLNGVNFNILWFQQIYIHAQSLFDRNFSLYYFILIQSRSRSVFTWKSMIKHFSGLSPTRLVFCCEFCKIFKNTFFTEHFRTIASVENVPEWLIVCIAIYLRLEKDRLFVCLFIMRETPKINIEQLIFL